MSSFITPARRQAVETDKTMTTGRTSSDWRERIKYCGLSHAELWIRDEGKCVYCDFDLLQSYAFAYYFYHYDHILPKRADKYPGLIDKEWNLVLACRVCNDLKSTFDPNLDAVLGDTNLSPVYTSSHTSLSSDERRELIRRTRLYLEAKKKGKIARFAADLEILREKIHSIHGKDVAKAAGT